MSALRFVSGLMVIALVLSSIALAQVPPAPTNLTVGPSPATVGAFLRWVGSAAAHGYKVYKAIDTAATFQRIATVQTTTYNDMMVGTGHTYRYYVTAFNSAGESGPSNVVTYTVQPPPPRVTGTVTGTVTNDSTGLPIRAAQVQFHRNSATNLLCAISDSLGRYVAQLDTGRYLISASKQGYRMEWYDNSPTPAGATPVNVSAGTTTNIDFGLAPCGPLPTPVYGTIAGTIVSDSTGAPIIGVRMRFYRTNGLRTNREARTDSLGFYQALLDTGRYLVYATKFGFRPEYFDNSPTPSGATPVRVIENQISTANFGLAPVGPPTPVLLVSVSGTVIDSATTQPIANASVAIIRPIRGVNTIQGLNGTPGGLPPEVQHVRNFGRMFGVVWQGRTDLSGNYTGRVPAGGTYIVFCGTAGYLPEWFDNKPTPMLADRLTLMHDTTGINFALNLNPLVQNSIAGSVVDSMGTGVPSHVVLFRATPNGGPRAVLHVMTDSLGSYVFRYLYAASYYVRAVPISGYAPAWYKAGAFGVQRWQDADTVRASGNVSGINVGVVPVVEGGISTIAGRISSTTGGFVDGAVVYAVISGTNTVAGFDITEIDGTFNLENLDPGSYRVVVDKEGFASASLATIDVGPSNNYQVSNANLHISPASPTGVREVFATIPQSHELAQNYPNPFNPTTNIEIRISNFEFVTLKVFDLLGREVVTLVNEYLPAGTYQTLWDAGGVASGVYLYRMQAGSFSETRRLVLMK